MTQEALKLALEWFEKDGEPDHHPVVTAIKEALAQPEQEPVAWQLWVGDDTPLNAPMGWQFYSTYDSLKIAEVSARTINRYQQAPFAKLIPLYTTPPLRLWVDLKNEERADCWSSSAVQFAINIEAKLKQLNT